MSVEAGMEELLSAERLSHTYAHVIQSVLCSMSDIASHKIDLGVNADVDSVHVWKVTFLYVPVWNWYLNLLKG